MSSTVHYGDIIMLYFSDNKVGINNTTMNIGKETAIKQGKGFLASTGFNDSGLYMNGWMDSFDYLIPSKKKFSKAAGKGEFRHYLFKIAPKLNSDLHSECKKILKIYKSIIKSIKLKNGMDKDLDDMKTNIENRLKLLSKSLEKEKLENLEMMNSYEGKPVSFGSEIQLLHYDSNSYISISNKCADTSKIGYICSLDTYFSRGMVLKILPKLKSRLEGEIIQYNDQIILKALLNQSYLSFDNTVELNKTFNKSDRNFTLRIKPSIFGEELVVFKAFFSSVPETSWYIMKFSGTRSDRYSLFGQDMVRIKHNETGGYLCSQFSYLQESPEVYLRVYTGNENEDEIAGESIFEIEHTKQENRGDRFPFLEWDEELSSKISCNISFRHFITGKVMSLIITDIGGQHKFVCTLEGGESTPVPLILYPTLKLKDYVTDRLSFYISTIHKEFLRCETSILYNREQLAKQMSSINSDRDYLLDDSFDELRHMMSFSEDIVTEDTFSISRVSPEEKESILFVKSSLKHLQELSNVFSNKKVMTLPSDHMFSGVEQILIKLNKFLFGATVDSIISYEENEPLEPMVSRQRLMKDFGVVDYIMDIIYFPFKNQFYQISELTQDMYFTKIMRFCYTTLKLGIQEYRPNEMYASQWLQMIINHSLSTHGENDINSGLAMKELIDNNRRILELRIDKKIINQFIKIVSNGMRDSRYLSILRAICICNGQGMIQNQKMLSELILCSEKTAEAILVPIKMTSENEIKVYISEEGIWENMLFLKSKTSQKRIAFYSYFISLIKLLADMCYNRNYIAIDFLQTFYDSRLCMKIITDHSYHFDIREAFCLLLRDLWINVSPFYEIPLPSKIKLWNNLSDGVYFPFYHGAINEYDKLKQFIPDYIDSCLKKEVVKNKKEIKFLNTLLDILHLMIKLGLYRKIEMINLIIKRLVQLLEKRLRLVQQKKQGAIIDNNANYDDANSKSKSALLESVKAKVCQVILAILQIQNEIRVNNLLFRIKTLAMSYYCNPFSSKNNSKELAKLLDDYLGKAVNIEEESFPTEKINTLVEASVRDNYYLDLKNDDKTVSLFLNLTLTKNINLKTEALKILYSMHSLRFMAKDILNEVSILDLKDSKKAYNQAVELSNVLRRYGEASEKWYYESDGKQFLTFKFMLEEIETLLLGKKKELIDGNLEEMSDNSSEEYSSQSASLQSSRESKFDQGGEIDSLKCYFIDTVKYKVDIFYQSIFRHLGIYDSLFEIIQGDLEIPREDLTQAHHNVIHRIYFILAHACRGSVSNKAHFKNPIKEFAVSHLQKSDDVSGVSLLFYEFMQDNPIILEEKEVQYFTHTLSMKIEKISSNDPSKAVLLNAICRMIVYKGFLVEENQKRILTILISKVKKNILINFGKKNIQDLFSRVPKELPKFTVNGIKIVIPDEKFIYLGTFLMLLSTCSEDGNVFADNICQIILPVKHLDSLIMAENINLGLRLSIAKFFLHVHLEDEKGIGLNLIEVYTPCLERLSEQFLEYSSFDNITDNTKHPQKKLYYCCFDGIKSLSDLVKDYEVTLVDIFLAVIKRMVRIDMTFLLRLERIFSNIIEGCIKFMDNSLEENHKVFLLLRFVMDRANKDFCSIAREKFFERYNTLKLMYMPKKDMSQNSLHASKGTLGTRTKTKFFKVGNSKAKLTMTSKQGPPPATALSLMNPNLAAKLQARKGEHMWNPSLAQTSNFEALKITKTDYLQNWISTYFNSDEYSKFCEDEFQSLIRIVMKIDQQGDENENNRLEEFLKSMSQFLLIDRSQISVDLLNIVLKLYIKYVKGNLEVEEDALYDQEVHYHERQNTLININIVEILCKALSNESNIDILENILNLAIEMIEEGNPNGQRKFLEYFLSDSNNLVLYNISMILQDSFEAICKEMNSKNEGQFNSIIAENDVGLNMNQLGTQDRDRDEGEDYSGVHSHIKFSILILRFLQLLCEGHNLEMQNILRDQPHILVIKKKIDFISIACDFLGSFVKVNNVRILDLGQQILDFLLETVQGPCPDNQLRLEEAKIIDICKDLLNEITIKKESKLIMNVSEDIFEKFNKLIRGTIKLLNSLQEGRTENKLVKSMADSFMFDILIKNIHDEYLLFVKRKSNIDIQMEQSKIESLLIKFCDNYRKEFQIDYFDDEVIEGFEIFFYLVNINDATNTFSDNIAKLKGSKKAAFRFFKENSKSVEIVFKGILQKVYFVVHPACWYLSERSMEKFMFEVDRLSMQQKLKDFVKATSKMIDEMEFSITQQSNKYNFLNIKFSLLRVWCFLVALTLNIGIFSQFNLVVEKGEAYTDLDFNESNIFFTIVGVVHLISSLMMLLSWLKQAKPLVTMDKWRESCSKTKIILQNDVTTPQKVKDTLNNIISKNIIQQTYQERLLVVSYLYESNGIPKEYILSKLRLFIQDTESVLNHPEFLYVLIYAFSSLVALRSNLLMLYSVFLVDISHRFDTLKNILKAITFNGYQLLMTTIFALVVVYIYALFAYYYLSETFYNFSIGDDGGENICTSVWTCFLTIFSLGPRSSGSIGDMLIRQDYQISNRTRYVVRFLYDVSCFLIINVIFMNLIFGIIIDAFAVLRDDNKQKLENINNICFICSLDRTKLEKEGKGFEYHSQNDHHVWNYLFYIYYLKRKEDTEYNGIESFVADCLNQDDILWFPIRQSLDVKEDIPDEVIIEEKVDEVADKLNQCVNIANTGLY